MTVIVPGRVRSLATHCRPVTAWTGIPLNARVSLTSGPIGVTSQFVGDLVLFKVTLPIELKVGMEKKQPERRR